MQQGKPRLILKSLRPYQWVKNALVLLPLLTSHQLTNTAKLTAALIAVAAFCLCASAGYVVNDLFDRETDRLHPRKANRPFASGELSPIIGVILALLLAAAGLGASLRILPAYFTIALVAYVASTLLYSTLLKRRLLMDVIFLAGLYTLRVAAGAFAIEVPLTAWLLAFSMFFFLSLAFVKRYVELTKLRDADDSSYLAGRGYVRQDSQIIESVGPASGYLSVLVLSLYINGEVARDLYQRPDLLWLACPILLYWITRIWFFAKRQALPDDPILFALTDRVSWIAAALTAALIVLASLKFTIAS